MPRNWSQNLKQVGATAITALALAGSFNATAHVGQDSVLKGHEGFVNKMQRPGGGMSCCHLQDGVGNVEEKVSAGADGTPHYKIKLTKDSSGNDLADPVWVDVPDEAVLSRSYARDFCSALRRDHPDDPDAATCTEPEGNVAWVPAFSSKPHTVYCYIPLRRGF